MEEECAAGGVAAVGEEELGGLEEDGVSVDEYDLFEGAGERGEGFDGPVFFELHRVVVEYG